MTALTGREEKEEIGQVYQISGEYLIIIT